MKAFLLLQAHFERLLLPITDYITDTISVLDQSIRVLQAYIDITAEQGCLSTTLMLCKTMVSIKQAIWDDSSPIAILPGVDPGLAHKFSGSLQSLPIARPQELRKIARKVGVGEDHMQKFFKVAHAMPNLQIKPAQSTVETIKIDTHRLGTTYGPDFKAYTPLFPKAQTEGWFVLLCDIENDEILALKRASFNQASRSTTKMVIPDECHGMTVTLMVVSDVYPGVVYEQELQLLGDAATDSTKHKTEVVVPSMSVDSGADKTHYVAGPQRE